MRLVSAKLKNICQHENAEFEFRAGITGVFGRNGVGKSNLFSMIAASLTNDFSVVPGTKEKNVRWGMPAGERSAITTEWEHDGRKFTIVRGLSPSKNELRISGNKPVTKSADIQSFLSDTLSCNKQLIDEFVFVRQGELCSFISSRPAARATLLAQLCQVEKAERLWSLLGDQIRADSPLAVMPTRDREDLVQRLEKENADCDKFRDACRRVKKDVLEPEEAEKVRDALCSYDKRRRCKEDLNKNLAQLRTCKERVASYEEKVPALREQAARTREAAEKAVEESTKARRRLDEQERLARDWSRKTSVENQLKKLSPKKPEQPTGYRPSSDVLLELGPTRIKCEMYEQRAELLGSGQECPTCGQELPHDTHENNEELAIRYRKSVQALEAQHQVAKTYEKQYAEWERSTSSFETQQSALRKELAHLRDIERPLSKDDCDKLKTIIYKTEKARTAARNARDDLLSAESRHEEAGTVLASLRKERRLLKKKLEAYANLPDLHETKKKWIAHKAAKDSLYKLRVSLKAAREVRDKTANWLEEVDAIAARAKDAKAWIEDLEMCRDCVHRDALPKLVVQRKLERIMKKANKLLEDLDAPFNVTAGDNLEFIAVKRTGQREAADRLSGAEKAILAIAFRFAVNAVFASELGMMVLDEPTAGLDERNMDVLADVLSRLASVAKRRDQQLIIITHDRRLERSFDQVLTLQ